MHGEVENSLTRENKGKSMSPQLEAGQLRVDSSYPYLETTSVFHIIYFYFILELQVS